jgi:hypothetical protein
VADPFDAEAYLRQYVARRVGDGPLEHRALRLAEVHGASAGLVACGLLTSERAKAIIGEADATPRLGSAARTHRVSFAGDSGTGPGRGGFGEKEDGAAANEAETSESLEVVVSLAGHGELALPNFRIEPLSLDLWSSSIIFRYSVRGSHAGDNPNLQLLWFAMDDVGQRYTAGSRHAWQAENFLIGSCIFRPRLTFGANALQLRVVSSDQTKSFDIRLDIRR